MTKSESNGLQGSHVSPPFTETAIVLRPATAIIFPPTLMLAGATTPGRLSLRHVSPESELEKKPFAVAANQCPSATSNAVIRVFNSATVEVRADCRFTGAPVLPMETTVRENQAEAPALS